MFLLLFPPLKREYKMKIYYFLQENAVGPYIERLTAAKIIQRPASTSHFSSACL